jgi:hypothetical protein
MWEGWPLAKAKGDPWIATLDETRDTACQPPIFVCGISCPIMAIMRQSWIAR